MKKLLFKDSVFPNHIFTHVSLGRDKFNEFSEGDKIAIMDSESGVVTHIAQIVGVDFKHFQFLTPFQYMTHYSCPDDLEDLEYLMRDDYAGFLPKSQVSILLIRLIAEVGELPNKRVVFDADEKVVVDRDYIPDTFTHAPDYEVDWTKLVYDQKEFVPGTEEEHAMAEIYASNPANDDEVKCDTLNDPLAAAFD